MDINGSTLTPHNKPMFYRLTYYTRKGWNFLHRYRQQPLYVINYLNNFYRKNYREKVNFLSDEEFLTQAKTRSTIRLGDGEFTLMLGTRGIIVQKFDPALREFFYTLAREYNKHSPYLLAMPPHINIENYQLDKHDFHFLWMPAKILFRLYFNKRASYTDAAFFYRKQMTQTFLSTVTPETHTIFVTNADNINKLKQKEKELAPKAHQVSYVETPPTSTFDLRDNVLAKIRDVINKSESRPMVIFACGPAGKVLTRTLALENITSHDVGSGISFIFDSEDHEWQMKWKEFGEIFTKNRNSDKRYFYGTLHS